MEDKSGGKEGEREEGRDGEGVLIFVYLTEREIELSHVLFHCLTAHNSMVSPENSY